MIVCVRACVHKVDVCRVRKEKEERIKFEEIRTVERKVDWWEWGLVRGSKRDRWILRCGLSQSLEEGIKKDMYSNWLALWKRRGKVGVYPSIWTGRIKGAVGETEFLSQGWWYWVCNRERTEWEEVIEKIWRRVRDEGVGNF